MTLQEEIRTRFGIGAACSTCPHKNRDCYTQNVTLHDICDLIRTPNFPDTIPKDRIPLLEHDRVVWYDDGLWENAYPVTIDSVDESTISFSNSECDDMDTYGRTWLLWTGKPPIEAKLKRG